MKNKKKYYTCTYSNNIFIARCFHFSIFLIFLRLYRVDPMVLSLHSGKKCIGVDNEAYGVRVGLRSWCVVMQHVYKRVLTVKLETCQ